MKLDFYLDRNKPQIFKQTQINPNPFQSWPEKVDLLMNQVSENNNSIVRVRGKVNDCYIYFVINARTDPN